MPSSPRASDVPPNGLIISQFAAAELSGLRQTRQILPIPSGGAKSQVPLIWLPAGWREGERFKSQEEPLRLKLVPTCCCLTSDGEEIFCYDCFVFHLLVINSRVTSEDATLFLYFGSTAAQDVDLLVSLLNKSVVSSQKTGIHRNSEVSPDAPSWLQPSGKSGGGGLLGGRHVGFRTSALTRCQSTTQQFCRGQMMQYGKHPGSRCGTTSVDKLMGDYSHREFNLAYT